MRRHAPLSAPTGASKRHPTPPKPKKKIQKHKTKQIKDFSAKDVVFFGNT
jgi:hypothetical protein